MKVVVVGAGLAGTAAALAARAAGAEVVCIGARPGASALWSGVAELFGPIYDTVDHQDLVGGPRLTAPGRPPLEDRAGRFDRLIRRRSFHPYARMALELDEVSDLARKAADALGLDLVWADAPTYVANLHGVVRLADGAAASIWRGRLRAEREIAVIGLEHFPIFSPDCAARALESQGLRAEAHWVGAGDLPQARSISEASARLEGLSDDALDALGARIAEVADGRAALLPPILGRSAEAHGRIFAKLAGPSHHTDLGEMASVHKSLHGFRFHQQLSARLDDAGVERSDGLVQRIADGSGRIEALELADGRQIDADAFVLATGRWFGGGLTRNSPFAESLLGLPLYLEGTPLDPVEQPAELATRRLFDDHPLFTVGVGVSSELQPLDWQAEPARENLYAAGLVVGGTNFARDGSAFGVALVTGWAAGRRAAGEEV